MPIKHPCSLLGTAHPADGDSRRSLVQWIVEQHHGRIDVVSEPGKGSCFIIHFPAAM
jgi:hypothetical protein